MAKGLYIGVDGKARKVKKIYTGINGKARKVKKGYIGIDGKARLFFSGEKKLSYYGTATALTTARAYLAAASIGDYAIFYGGYNGTIVSAKNQNMDIYNSSLVKVTNNSRGFIRNMAAASNSSYAMFGGGQKYDDEQGSEEAVSTVRAIDGNLTTTLTSFTNVAKKDLAATTVNDYVLFGGGYNGSRTIYATVDAYDTNLTKTTPTPLSQGRYGLAATTIGDYALFGGGSSSNYTEVYDTDLVKSTATPLSEARKYLAATTVGNYALFGGGCYDGNNKNSKVVDVYQVSESN